MDVKLKLANAAVLLGVLGFAACWVIGRVAEMRVFSSPAYLEKTLVRTDVIWIKNEAYYLEPTYAMAVRASNYGVFWTFGLALLGGGYLERRKRKRKSEQLSLLAQSAWERDENKE
jgi:hypothetical protein